MFVTGQNFGREDGVFGGEASPPLDWTLAWEELRLDNAWKTSHSSIEMWLSWLVWVGIWSRGGTLKWLHVKVELKKLLHASPLSMGFMMKVELCIKQWGISESLWRWQRWWYTILGLCESNVKSCDLYFSLAFDISYKNFSSMEDRLASLISLEDFLSLRFNVWTQFERCLFSELNHFRSLCEEYLSRGKNSSQALKILFLRQDQVCSMLSSQEEKILWFKRYGSILT